VSKRFLRLDVHNKYATICAISQPRKVVVKESRLPLERLPTCPAGTFAGVDAAALGFSTQRGDSLAVAVGLALPSARHATAHSPRRRPLSPLGRPSGTPPAKSVAQRGCDICARGPGRSCPAVANSPC
jgi:hypothetical protein